MKLSGPETSLATASTRASNTASARSAAMPGGSGRAQEQAWEA
jgi:hypothetical protein